VAKRTLISNLRLAFDTAEEVSGYFAEDEILGRPHSYWQTYLEGIESVTGDDVMRAARDYLQPKQWIFLVVGRWTEMAGGADAGTSNLERNLSHRVTHLPGRDPLTLEPQALADKLE
jgi:hypothetical protein